MTSSVLGKVATLGAVSASLLMATSLFIAAHAETADKPSLSVSGKLLLTGGVNTIEGTAGGGLTPWAVIAGYGTNDQIGGNVFATQVRANDYTLNVTGAAIGLYDRVELSYAEQRFDTRAVGGALGLGNGYTFTQKIGGAKVRIIGDAVLEQDSWVPQVAFGMQHKENNRGALLNALGIKNDSGTDYYISATKLYLNQSLLLNGTVRWTKANQTGILGFSTAAKDKYQAQAEGSAAILLRRDLAVGAEFRQKPNNLPFKEDNWYDVFVAYSPTKNVTVTLAYVDLGNIVIKDKQKATYLSLQVGF